MTPEYNERSRRHSPNFDCVLARDWLKRTDQRLLPSSFPQIAEEHSFLYEYRQSGLRTLRVAFLAAFAAFVVFAILSGVADGEIVSGFAARGAALLSLGLVLIVLFVFGQGVIGNYVPLMSALGVLGMVGSSSTRRFISVDSELLVAAPTSAMALWLLFAFFRLPLGAALGVAAIGSAYSVVSGLYVTNLPYPLIRTILYLAFSIALGVLLASSIEMRERRLFLQRRLAEYVQDELELKSQAAMIASADKARLMATVAHDLRQPMMAAMIHLSLVDSRATEEDLNGVTEHLGRARASLSLLGELLEHLLETARGEAARDSAELEKIPLIPVLMNAVETVKPQALKEGVDFRIRLPQNEVFVLSNATTLLRILINLLSNAIRFSAPEKVRMVVILRASYFDDECLIQVVDNGVGIEAANLARVWLPFFQAGNPERTRENGLGLGLSLVRQAIERMKGHSVSVKSVVGYGSRFSVRLPMAPPGLGRSIRAGLSGVSEFDCSHAPRVEKVYRRSDGVTSSGEIAGMYVLVLEDDRLSRDAIEAQLSSFGVLFVSAASVEELLALNEMNDRVVDAIIADFRLPGRLNGIESIVALRSAIGVPVDAVLISAEVDREALRVDLPPGTAFLPKPFVIAEFIQWLGMAVANARARERALDGPLGPDDSVP